MSTTCFLAAGCGGSDDSSSSSDDPAAATEDSAAPAEEDAASDGNESESAEAVDADVPNLSEGAWEGTIHFEISGDVELRSADIPGGALTAEETSRSCRSPRRHFDGIKTSQVAFSNDPAQESAVFVSPRYAPPEASSEGVQRPMSTNDETSAVGDFECEGVSGALDDEARESNNVNIQGSFTLQKSS